MPKNPDSIADDLDLLPELEEAQPWDQLPDETDEWYDRFLAYLQQPPKRSFRRTYEQYGLGGSGDQYKVSIVWRRKIAEFKWAERAASYDVHVRMLRLADHKNKADEVYDKLYSGAIKAVNTLVFHATVHSQAALEDHVANGGVYPNPQRSRVQIDAATRILDRLGFTKRAARPIYSESATSTDEPVKIELVGLTKEMLGALSGEEEHDDEDEAVYE